MHRPAEPDCKIGVTKLSDNIKWQPSQEWLEGYALGYKRGQLKVIKVMLESVRNSPDAANKWDKAVIKWLTDLQKHLKRGSK